MLESCRTDGLDSAEFSPLSSVRCSAGVHSCWH